MKKIQILLVTAACLILFVAVLTHVFGLGGKGMDTTLSLAAAFMALTGSASGFYMNKKEA